MKEKTPEEKRAAVRENYAKVAGQESPCGCNPSSACCGPATDVKAVSEAIGYSPEEVKDMPEGANLGLGCGNPLAIAGLKTGETVLDLGSGGGFDCFLAARQVGDEGSVVGVDMTPEMVDKARKNASSGGYKNVEFRLGEIEHIPLPDSSVDVIMSNCVVNLSPDKAQVFRDAFRVLRPGGRLSFSDIVAVKPLPDEIKNDLSLLSGCIAGAALVSEIEDMLVAVGFTTIKIETKPDSRDMINEWAPGTNAGDYVLSATIEARKTLSDDTV